MAVSCGWPSAHGNRWTTKRTTKPCWKFFTESCRLLTNQNRRGHLIYSIPTAYPDMYERSERTEVKFPWKAEGWREWEQTGRDTDRSTEGDEVEERHDRSIDREPWRVQDSRLQNKTLDCILFYYTRRTQISPPTSIQQSPEGSLDKLTVLSFLNSYNTF